MSEQQNSSLTPAVIGLVGVVLGAAIGGSTTLASQFIQGNREITSQCIAANIKREELLRQKAEPFAAALSDQLSFFQQNNEIELRKAQEKLADLQKAAFVLTVYANQDLSVKSLAAVTAINATLAPTSEAELLSAAKRLHEAAAAWHPSFRAELKAIADERLACKS